MRKRWAVFLVLAFCAVWLTPMRVDATAQLVVQTVEDCKTGTITQYYYDELGRVIRKTDNLGNCEITSYFEDYSYNPQDKIELILEYCQNKPVQFTRYDSQENLLFVQTWLEDGTIRSERYVNSYDLQGRLVAVQYTDSVGKEVKAFADTTYQYFKENESDGIGSYVERHEFYNEEDGDPHHVRLTYYDFQGRMLSDEYYDCETGVSECVANLYDSYGSLTECVWTNGIDSIQRNQHNNTYDDNGNLVVRESKHETMGPDGTIWYIEYDSYKYKYDEAGRMIYRGYLVYEEELDWMSWEYDKYGNLLKHLKFNEVVEEYKYTHVPLSEAIWQNNQ